MARCGCAGAGGSVGVADSPSLDLSILASVISGDVKLDPNVDNLLEILAGGLNLDCADVAACIGTAADVGVTDSPGINFSTSGAGTPGNPRLISGDLIPVYYQTSSLTFTRNLTGAADVFEEVTELPGLVLATAGTYFVVADVGGTATVTGASLASSANVSFQLRRNGVLMPNTESRLSFVSQGTVGANPAEPALGVGTTGSVVRAVASGGADVITLWAAQNETVAGNTATITSNGTGRTRISAWRIGV